MSVAAVPQPDLEQPPLVAELEYLRALLEGGYAPHEPEAPEREPAVDRLARLFGLSPFERRVLLLAAAVELDGEIAALVQAHQQTPDARPMFGLALSTLPHPHWDALAPTRPSAPVGALSRSTMRAFAALSGSNAKWMTPESFS